LRADLQRELPLDHLFTLAPSRALLFWPARKKPHRGRRGSVASRRDPAGNDESAGHKFNTRPRAGVPEESRCTSTIRLGAILCHAKRAQLHRFQREVLRQGSDQLGFGLGLSGHIGSRRYGAGLTSEKRKMNSGLLIEPDSVKLVSFIQSVSERVNVPEKTTFWPTFKAEIFAKRVDPGSISVWSEISDKALLQVFMCMSLAISISRTPFPHCSMIG
jgi:hypothetical protein